MQFIPARGRKQFHFITFFLFLRDCNLSPRGDGNRLSSRSRAYKVIAIYPREGTETKVVLQFFGLYVLQFIPARGRKPLPIQSTIFLAVNCNLSPRGDGNLTLDKDDRVKRKLQFIPARGRKRYNDGGCFGLAYCNLSPQGDGNILLLTWKENRSIIDLSL